MERNIKATWRSFYKERKMSDQTIPGACCPGLIEVASHGDNVSLEVGAEGVQHDLTRGQTGAALARAPEEPFCSSLRPGADPLTTPKAHCTA